MVRDGPGRPWSGADPCGRRTTGTRTSCTVGCTAARHSRPPTSRDALTIITSVPGAGVQPRPGRPTPRVGVVDGDDPGVQRQHGGQVVAVEVERCDGGAAAGEQWDRQRCLQSHPLGGLTESGPGHRRADVDRHGITAVQGVEARAAVVGVLGLVDGTASTRHRRRAVDTGPHRDTAATHRPAAAHHERFTHDSRRPSTSPVRRRSIDSPSLRRTRKPRSRWASPPVLTAPSWVAPSSRCWPPVDPHAPGLRRLPHQMLVEPCVSIERELRPCLRANLGRLAEKAWHAAL